MDQKTLNVADVIDRSPIGGLQVRLFVLCGLCLIMAGFIVQSIGFVAPDIIREWGVENAAMAPVFGMGNMGILVGALVFTMVADTFGRRPVLVGTTLFFSVVTLLTPQAGSVQELLVLRFIAGLGLGSVIPNATALIGEYSPKRSRVTLMMCVTVGFTAGAAFGGFVAAWLIPSFGWRAVFYVGGAIPLAIAVAMYFWLPESLQFIVVRRRGVDRARTWLQRIDRQIRLENVELVVPEEHRRGVPAIHLFRSGRGPATVLLWIINFMNILIVYSLANWIPTVIRDAGYETSTAVLVGTVLQVGGTLGTFAFAALISWRGFLPVLASSFAVAVLAIAMIGPAVWSLTLLMTTVFVAGWCSIGAQPGLNALAATFYPTYLRSTGVGWCLGIGRTGAIVGPMLFGELLRRQWSSSELFYAAAVPALIATLGMIVLRFAMRKPEGIVQSTPAVAHGS
jgi:MFS transporter, AAHS family, 4-hydroxybenzoate transporter